MASSLDMALDDVIKTKKGGGKGKRGRAGNSGGKAAGNAKKIAKADAGEAKAKKGKKVTADKLGMTLEDLVKTEVARPAKKLGGWKKGVGTLALKRQKERLAQKGKAPGKKQARRVGKGKGKGKDAGWEPRRKGKGYGKRARSSWEEYEYDGWKGKGDGWGRSAKGGGKGWGSKGKYWDDWDDYGFKGKGKVYRREQTLENAFSWKGGGRDGPQRVAKRFLGGREDSGKGGRSYSDLGPKRRMSDDWDEPAPKRMRADEGSMRSMRGEHDDRDVVRSRRVMDSAFDGVGRGARGASRPVTMGGRGSTKIRVSNVPKNLNWRDIKEAFQDLGRVVRCEVERGLAFVEFENPTDARKAVQTFDRGEMNGQTISVTLDP